MRLPPSSSSSGYVTLVEAQYCQLFMVEAAGSVSLTLQVVMSQKAAVFLRPIHT
jgi:hypothetical protein